MAQVPSRLGPYEILGPLGAGGMGEVHRARDTRLGREVAIKVLPAAVADSPELRARFEREARTIAALNHPNVCTVHDVGREDGVDYLVMERIEGETLADRLRRGALPPAEVLRIGADVARALDAAHRAGVVHRDLKPGNIMLTRSGAKLMDFGLALAREPAPASSDLSAMPTAVAPITAQGSIVGTVPYMAPEQLEGRPADARTDLWALGCVLYEMASGRRAFEGASHASLIGAILRDEPRPLGEFEPLSPAGLDRAVRQCLAKDPVDRWQSAGDLKRELEWIASSAGDPRAAPARESTRSATRAWLPWAAAAVAIAAIALVVAGMRSRPAEALPARLSLPLSPTLDFGALPTARISPDGRWIVYWASGTGEMQLHVRPIDGADSRVLGTGAMPFFSPDGRWLAFFEGDRIMKRPITGGAPVTICETAWMRGASWGPGDRILFSGGPTAPLSVVDAGGGEPRVVTALDTTRGESAHRFPCFLPDGERFLFAALPIGRDGYAIRLGSLKGGAGPVLFSAQCAPVYVDPGWLVFVREGSIMAQRFDARAARLRGEPVVLADAPPPSGVDAMPTFGVSSAGHLVYVQTPPRDAKLVWLDAAGRTLEELPLPPRPWSLGALRPDGRIATMMEAGALWNVDLDRHTVSLLADASNGALSDPVWSFDGTRLAFTRAGVNALQILDFEGGGSVRRFGVTRALFQEAKQWLPGDQMLVGSVGDETTWDLWAVQAGDSATARPLVNTAAFERFGAWSPDGRRFAWTTSTRANTQSYDLMVRTEPPTGPPIQITQGGVYSTRPFWSRDGSELWFGVGDGMWSARMAERGGRLEVGRAERRFDLPYPGFVDIATLDGERFLAAVPVRRDVPGSQLHVVVNWPALAARR
jgi:hypothetical protein